MMAQSGALWSCSFSGILTRKYVCHGRILCQSISLLAMVWGKVEYCRLIYTPDTRYVRGLCSHSIHYGVECKVAGLHLNIMAYADDMVLLSPYWHAMHKRLCILDSRCHDLDMTCNTNKTVCMALKPHYKDRVVANEFSCFNLGEVKLKFVEQFRNMLQIFSNSANDDEDSKRKIQNLYIRTNMVINRFLPLLYSCQKDFI